MAALPDKKRSGVTPPARALAASLARVAAAAAWRSMHPAARERYVEAPAPRALTRLYYAADDGWRSSVLVLPAAPGGAGEPVVLAHALGFKPDAFRYGAGPTLAGALSDAGFTVYLLSHRGDAESIAPSRAADFDFDDVVERDLPAALDRVREHAECPRVHFVGHGLGGQLGLAWAGRTGGDGLASLVALCAPVRFAAPRSEAIRATVVTALLPSHWRVPVGALGPVAAPWLGDERTLFGHLRPGASSRARVRGVLHHGVDDVPVALLRQVARWVRVGAMVDRTGLLDYGEALAAARVPLLLAASAGDELAPPDAVWPAAERWGGERDVLRLPDGYGHLDALLARDAEAHVFRPVVAWLESRRQRAWIDGPVADIESPVRDD